MTVLLDFESRSRCDLKLHGGRLYWEHPTTEALCCVLYSTETNDVEVWSQGEPPPALATRGEPLAAHNAMGFDRFPALLLWGVDVEVDTAELAKRAGLPGALDALAKRWLDRDKDLVGSRFTKSLSRPSRAQARLGQLPKLTEDVMDRVRVYCTSDVEIMAHGWDLLKDWQGLEDDVEAVDRQVNDTGVPFDADLARALLLHDERMCEDAVHAASKAIGATPEETRAAAMSPIQFCAATGLPNAQKATVAKAVDDHPLCRARQALASIARGKLTAGLHRMSSDERIRDSHNYYGAHTGRWSGRGMQLQNMPRPAGRFEKWTGDEINMLADVALAGEYPIDAEEIDLMLRATICASPGKSLVVCDFSGVEARALAWAADDHKALEVFKSPLDPYKVMASTIFGKDYDSITKEDRGVGKIAELACGYGMGAKKLQEDYGKKLAAAGVTGAEVVSSWRRQHAASVQLWAEMERGFATAYEGGHCQVSVFEFAPASDGTDAIACILPSGRPVVYNSPAVGIGNFGRPSLTYHGHYGQRHVYGGLLVENAIQAMCRDMLADAMVRVSDAGLDIVMHVHDEIVCEEDEGNAAEAYIELRRNMLVLPEWAPNFPVGAEGFHGKRYRK